MNVTDAPFYHPLLLMLSEPRGTNGALPKSVLTGAPRHALSGHGVQVAAGGLAG